MIEWQTLVRGKVVWGRGAVGVCDGQSNQLIAYWLVMVYILVIVKVISLSKCGW